MTRIIEKKAPAGKSVTRKKAPSAKELVGPGMGNTSSILPPLISKKRKSESASLFITDESTGAAAKKSKMMASESPTNQPASLQKPSAQRPHPRPLAKKANVGGKSSVKVTVSGNAQETETVIEKGNKKRSNPAEDSDEGHGSATDPATPVPPAKKVKGSAQTAKPLRRTGICFTY